MKNILLVVLVGLMASACASVGGQDHSGWCSSNCQFVADTCEDSLDFDVVACTDDCAMREHTDESMLQHQACAECFVSLAECNPLYLNEYCRGACDY